MKGSQRGHKIQTRVLSIEIPTFSSLRYSSLHRCLPSRPYALMTRLAISPDHRQRWVIGYIKYSCSNEGVAECPRDMEKVFD